MNRETRQIYQNYWPRDLEEEYFLVDIPGQSASHMAGANPSYVKRLLEPFRRMQEIGYVYINGVPSGPYKSDIMVSISKPALSVQELLAICSTYMEQGDSAAEQDQPGKALELYQAAVEEVETGYKGKFPDERAIVFSPLTDPIDTGAITIYDIGWRLCCRIADLSMKLDMFYNAHEWAGQAENFLTFMSILLRHSTLQPPGFPDEVERADESERLLYQSATASIKVHCKQRAWEELYWASKRIPPREDILRDINALKEERRADGTSEGDEPDQGCLDLFYHFRYGDITS